MTAEPARTRQLWVGTYPVAGQGTPTGRGEGIWTVTLDVGSGTLSTPRQVATTPAPSYLAHGLAEGVLYAVNEEAEGGLTAFVEDDEALRQIGRAPTGGENPCHLLIHRDSRTALVANYSSGSFGMVPLDPDGRPDGQRRQLCTFSGSGPDASRQATSHAHYVLGTPDPATVLVVDLGADCVRRLRIDPGGRLEDRGIAVKLPPGTGPRHAALSEDRRRLYVIGELDGRVHTVAWDAPSASGVVVDSVPVIAAGPRSTDLAHVVRVPTGLVVGCRGAGVLAVHGFTADGLPRPDRVLPLPGAWPRHHAFVDGWLVVAQQTEGGVITMDLAGTTRGTAQIPSPACILPDLRPSSTKE